MKPAACRSTCDLRQDNRQRGLTAEGGMQGSLSHTCGNVLISPTGVLGQCVTMEAFRHHLIWGIARPVRFSLHENLACVCEYFPFRRHLLPLPPAI